MPDGVEVYKDDATSNQDLKGSLALVNAGFYLIPSKLEGSALLTEERSMAQRFAQAA